MVPPRMLVTKVSSLPYPYQHDFVLIISVEFITGNSLAPNFLFVGNDIAAKILKPLLAILILVISAVTPVY